ncbi:hypothetical protein NL676_030895 [Syzygium grande]|nr:hypothetical protein NL676_030895 [Syzygium grande]
MAPAPPTSSSSPQEAPAGVPGLHIAAQPARLALNNPDLRHFLPPQAPVMVGKLGLAGLDELGLSAITGELALVSPLAMAGAA